MAAYFCDSSALVKRYITEKGSTWLTAKLDPKVGNFVFIARITFVEVISAISRKERGGHISAVDAITAQTRFETDYLGEFFNLEITETLIKDSAILAKTYALRGYDAVQLAAALQTQQTRTTSNLTPLTFLSSDSVLNDAALSEGFTVDDPNNH